MDPRVSGGVTIDFGDLAKRLRGAADALDPHDAEAAPCRSCGSPGETCVCAINAEMIGLIRQIADENGAGGIPFLDDAVRFAIQLKRDTASARAVRLGPCKGSPGPQDDLSDCGKPSVETVNGFAFCAACAAVERQIIAEESEKLEKPAGEARAVPSSEDPAQSPVDRIPAGTGQDGAALPAPLPLQVENACARCGESTHKEALKDDPLLRDCFKPYVGKRICPPCMLKVAMEGTKAELAGEAGRGENTTPAAPPEDEVIVHCEEANEDVKCRWGRGDLKGAFHLWREGFAESECLEENCDGEVLFAKPVPDNTCMTCAALAGLDLPEVVPEKKKPGPGAGDSGPAVGERWANLKTGRIAAVQLVTADGVDERHQIAFRDVVTDRLSYAALRDLGENGRWRFLGPACIAPDCETAAESHALTCTLHAVDGSIQREWLWARLGVKKRSKASAAPPAEAANG